MKKKAKSLVGWWRNHTPTLRVLTLIMWPSGCIIVALGVIGDQFRFWNNQSFLTNLVSSIAGACFGIPFALLVLQHIVNNQSTLVERRRAVAMCRQLVFEMYKTSQKMGLSPMPDVEEVRENIESIMSDYADMDLSWSFDSFSNQLNEQVSRVIAQVPSNKDLERSIYRYRSAWDLLRGDIRLRLAGAEIAWPFGDHAADIDKSLLLAECSLPNIAELREAIRKLNWSPSDETGEALDAIDLTEFITNKIDTTIVKVLKGIDAARDLSSSFNILYHTSYIMILIYQQDFDSEQYRQSLREAET